MGFVGMVHDLLVFEAVLVTRRLLEPVGQRVDDFGDVVVIEGEVEVGDFASFVKEWFVNKMPSLLIFAFRLALDEIGIGRTFCERMLLLIDSPIWIDILESLKDGEG